MNARQLVGRVAVWLVLVGAPVQAQWLTQSFALKQGWNAVHFDVDSSYETLDRLVGLNAPAETPIQEVWLWTPNLSTQQFIQSPQQPIDSGSQWLSWKKNAAGTSQLQRLAGNVACLVHCTADFTWDLKGRAVLPHQDWSVSGLNFLGFSTVPVAPPSFDGFLGEVPELLRQAEVFRYPGGDLGPGNPGKVFNFRSTQVRRGEAFWIRTGSLYNSYAGPFEVLATGTDGVNFSDNLGAVSVRLRNRTAHALTVTLQLDESESAPVGQRAVAGVPPLLVRGTLNRTNLTYGHTALPVGASNSWTLQPAGQPGSEAEVVLGLNRFAVTAPPGELLAGLLRFTDSLGHLQVNLPVTAVTASHEGLWVGTADVRLVGAYLKSFQKNGGTNVIGTNNAYIVTGINTNLASASRPFPLRLILHTDNTNTYLFQRIYYGLSPGTNFINATRESLLDPNRLATARRISAVHLPVTSTNTFWKCVGTLQPGTNLTTTVSLAHSDQASNPFLHTYHPDHDNLDTAFDQQLAPGFESYTVNRTITLSLTPPGEDFNSITRSGQTFTGTYHESVNFGGKGSESRTFESAGSFTLNRLNRIGTLTTQ